MYTTQPLYPLYPPRDPSSSLCCGCEQTWPKPEEQLSSHRSDMQNHSTTQGVEEQSTKWRRGSVLFIAPFPQISSGRPNQTNRATLPLPSSVLRFFLAAFAAPLAAFCGGVEEDERKEEHRGTGHSQGNPQEGIYGFSACEYPDGRGQY